MAGNENKRVAQHIRERRNELGLKQSELKDRGGPSPETVIKFEQGKISMSVQPRTLHGFDRALSWRLGSTQSILEGGEPAPLMPEAVQQATNSTQQPVVSTWVRVPRCTIQNLSISVAKLALLAMTGTKLPADVSAQLADIQAQVQILTGMVDSFDRGDPELLLLADSNAPLDPNGLRIENLGSIGGLQNGNGES